MSLSSSAFARTSRQLRSTRTLTYCARIRHVGLLPARPSSLLRQRPVVGTGYVSQHLIRCTTIATTSQKATPRQPAYEPPSTGILSVVPSSWVPYAELIRIDKPAGTNYLFLPCIFSTLLAAPLASPMTTPSSIVSTIALFYAGAVVMRGAGCTINDLWDRNLDPHVARTRLRPIARGAVTVRQALPFLGAQLAVGLAILLQFPTECFFYAAPSLVFVALYPLAKRVTYYPQFVLGLTFSWGAFVGFPALGVDLLANSPALISAACLYSSCVAWTLIYDMIYAYQDIRDDAKAGIKSIALAHEGNAKALMSAIAVVQTTLLAGAGYAIGAGPIYYLATCGGAGSTLAYTIRVVDLNNVKDCWAWFKRGAILTGGVISAGLGFEYAAQYNGWYGKQPVAEVLR